MPPALLNKRIAIQQQTSAQDATGGLVGTWSTVYQCWASIDWQTSALNDAPGEFISEVVHRITFRYPDVVIGPADRIIYLDQRLNVQHTYVVKAIQNVRQGNVWLVALCFELGENE